MPILRARRGAIVGAVAAEKAAATLVGSDRRVGLVVGLLAAAVPVAPAVLGVGVIVGLLDRGRVGLADRAHLVFRGSRALAEGLVRRALGAAVRARDSRGVGALGLGVIVTVIVGLRRHRYRCRS